MAERKMHHFDANNQCKEKLQENPIFKGEISGFRLGFSLKPIHANNIYKSFFWEITHSSTQAHPPALRFGEPLRHQRCTVGASVGLGAGW